MGILSNTVSITRYRVEGKLPNPVMEAVLHGLETNIFQDIDGEQGDKSVGWTSFDRPFRPNFSGSSFVMDTRFIFSLRIDKKTIPPKVLSKHVQIAVEKKLAETDREYLSKNEKKEIRDHVETVLFTRIPAVPSVVDLIWHYEDGLLWFFSNQKSANEELEALFVKSFRLTLIRLFPYTMTELMPELSPDRRDALSHLSPARLMEASQP